MKMNKKRKNESIRDREKQRKIEKKEQVLWTRPYLNNVQNWQKEKMKKESNSNLVKPGEYVK